MPSFSSSGVVTVPEEVVMISSFSSLINSSSGAAYFFISTSYYRISICSCALAIEPEAFGETDELDISCRLTCAECNTQNVISVLFGNSAKIDRFAVKSEGGKAFVLISMKMRILIFLRIFL